MELFFQSAALVLLTVILAMSLRKQAEGTAGVLVMVAGVLVLGAAGTFLQRILEFLEQIRSLAQLSDEMMGILCKCVGIGILSEIAGMICSDSGNASLGKSLQIFSSVVILWLSIPMFQALLELVQKILEAA